MKYRKIRPIFAVVSFTLFIAIASGCNTSFRKGGGGGGGSGSNATTVAPAPTCAELAGAAYNSLGSGTSADPYLLCTAAQLLDLMRPANSAAWKYFYKLGANIDLTGYNEASTPAVNSIGSSATPFTGNFDGQGHSISNLSYSNGTQDNAGLFGVISGSITTIKNLSVLNVSITAHDNVGGLVGFVQNGAAVTNCQTSGTISANQYVGGVAGLSTVGTILSASSSSANVTVSMRGGGFVGGLDGYALNCFATGNVSGGIVVGGFMGEGYNNGSGVVLNSYASGSVSGASSIGGFAAFAPALCRNCFVTGNVAATGNDTNTGRLIGGAPAANIVVNSFSYSGSTCTINSGLGACHAAVSGETSNATLSNFYNPALAPLSSWNFSGVWQAGAGLPTLSPVFFDSASWGTCASHVSDTPFAGGNGSFESPYLICTPAQLDALASTTSYWNASAAFRVMNNLDLSGLNTASFPIGSSATPFNGLFDGNGKTISNFSLSRSAGDLGFFGTLAGSVRRVGLVNVNVADTGGSGGTGGLVGHGLSQAGVGGASIFDSYVTGSVSGWTVGGVLGWGSPLVIDVYSTATINAGYRGSGLADLFNGVGLNSFASASVTGGSGGGGPTNSTGVAFGNTFYDSSQPCTGCTVYNGTAQASTAYFYNSANSPLNSWDFTNIWMSNSPTGFPTLR